MKKKICSAVLAVVMACSVGMGVCADETSGLQASQSVSCSVQYGATKTYKGFKYKVRKDGNIELLSYSGSDKKVKIPSKINGKKVTSICTSQGDSLFSNSSKAVSVTVPASVTKIGSTAFWSTEGSLGAISVDKSNKNYSSVDGVLYNKKVTTLIFCPKKKKSVSIPKTVTKIGDSSFSCSDVSSVTIPSSVTEIGDDAFDDCVNLTRIRVPKSVKKLGIQAMGYLFNTGYGQTNLTIECYKGSAAEKYATSQEMCYTKFYINYLIIDKKPSTPKIKKANRSKTSVRLYFSNVKGISGFKVQQYDSKSKKWKDVGKSRINLYNTDNNGYNYKIKGLKSGTKYKYRVLAYTSPKGSKTLKSGWSKTFTVTTK